MLKFDDDTNIFTAFHALLWYFDFQTVMYI